MFGHKTLSMPLPEECLPGRLQPLPLANQHSVKNAPLMPPFPDNCEQIIFGMGCFWGAERKFWLLPGVFTTAVGYSAGFTPNPSYEEVCSGLTGHNEVVLVVYEPDQISLAQLLKVFWEAHDPTQGMRQGNDRGTQYRSGIYYSQAAQLPVIEDSKVRFQAALDQQGLAKITTEILPVKAFYYAENYHQQYLHKNPNGYCGLGGTGVCLA